MSIYETTGREIDPIDDVRCQLETAYTNYYFDPTSGDWLSDDYLRTIDLATQPNGLNEHEVGRLSRSIARLNNKYAYIQAILRESSLQTAYTAVAEQINEITAADTNLRDIERMKTTLTEEIAA